MKIPATVITGFLGAGKTSLIRHLLQHANGARIAVIINEFGDLGVDRELLLGCGDAACDGGDVIELANGCICCTVADEFLPTMERLLARQPAPDHIVIETSGLALPKPLVKAFQWPAVRARVTVDGVITVVDAAAVAEGRFAPEPLAPLAAAGRVPAAGADHDQPLRELFEDQLACADLIMVNKTDQVAADALDALQETLTALRPAATKVVTTRHGALDVRVALGLAASAEEGIDGRRCHHDAPEDDHDHDEFMSFIAPLGEIGDPDALVERLRGLAAAHDILRIKGFVAVEGKPMRLAVQGVGGRMQRYFDRPWAAGEPRESRLVVIGERGLDAAAVRAALQEL
jgi:cobalamin biosynthesis protein CobW